MKNKIENRKAVTVKEHTREVKESKSRDDYIRLMIESGRFPVEKVVFDVPEEDRFDSSGNPMERIGEERMMRDMGVPIRRNVTSEWFISSAELAGPLWEAMKDEEKKLAVIHADETFWTAMMTARLSWMAALPNPDKLEKRQFCGIKTPQACHCEEQCAHSKGLASRRWRGNPFSFA